MPIDLAIQNLRSIRQLHLQDPTKCSVIVAPNARGKSTLTAAIGIAGASTAFNRKGKDLAELVAFGESTFQVRLAIPGTTFAANRSLTNGDTAKSIATALQVPVETLPLLFNTETCTGDGGSKALKAFLAAQAALGFDPVTFFANDPTILPSIQAARKSGAVTTKQIIKFCIDSRAAQRAPDAPIPPTVPRPDHGALLNAQEDLAAAQATLSKIGALLAPTEGTAHYAAWKALVDAEASHLRAHNEMCPVMDDAYAELAALNELLAYYQIAIQHEKIAADAAAGKDPLGTGRAALVELAATASGTFGGQMGELLGRAKEGAAQANQVEVALLCEDALRSLADFQVNLQAASGLAVDALSSNPLPMEPDPLPVLSERALAIRGDIPLERWLHSSNSVNIAELAVQQEAYRNELEVTVDTSATAHAQAQDERMALERDLANHERATISAWVAEAEQLRNTLEQATGAWAAYDENMQRYPAAQSSAKMRWELWDIASKRIEEAELAFLATEGNRFGNTVNRVAEILLEGRQIEIDADNGIRFIGLPIDLAAKSDRWLVECAVSTAIGITLGAPILCLDAADILNPERAALLDIFLEEVAIPNFQHVIVTRTNHNWLESEPKSDSPLLRKYLLDENSNLVPWYVTEMDRRAAAADAAQALSNPEIV